MTNWRSFGDRLLYCHRSRLKTWCKCSNPARFHNSSTTHSGGGGGGDLLLGGIKKAATFPRIPGCSSCSPPPVSPPRSLSSSPLLMLPPGVVVVDDPQYSVNNSSSNDDYFHFFSLSEERQFRVGKNLRIPWQRDLLTPNAAQFGGSSHGWLAFTDRRNGQPYLYNPLMESPDFPYIPLPSFETLRFFCGVRQLKPSPLSPSPSPSLLTQFLSTPGYPTNFNVKVDTHEHVSCEDEMNNFYLEKLVMSSAPSLPCYSSSSPSSLRNDCTIMAVHSPTSEIVFCKPGDDRWTVLLGTYRNFTDMIYFSKDKRFYVVTDSHNNFRMEAWDLKDPFCPKNQVLYHSKQKYQVFVCPHFYLEKFQDKLQVTYNLVESSGDLLLLSRFRVQDKSCFLHPEKVVENKINDEEWKNDFRHHDDDDDDDDAYWTRGFNVHKFDFDHSKWEPVECLGDRAFFVDFNNCFSLSTRDYPELMRNSIYFTSTNHDNYHDNNYLDNGIFHLEEGCIKPCYPRRLKIIDSPLVWVAPNTM